MRVAFTGSRHWTNEDQIRRVLTDLKEAHGHNLEVCHGKSRGGGVDLFVEEIAEDLDIASWPFPVRGGRTGVDGNVPRVAPLNRNKRMLLSFMPDLLIAFRSPGKSNGTDHTMTTAAILGIPVELHEED